MWVKNQAIRLLGKTQNQHVVDNFLLSYWTECFDFRSGIGDFGMSERIRRMNVWGTFKWVNRNADGWQIQFSVGEKTTHVSFANIWVVCGRALNFSLNIHSLDFFHQRCLCTLWYLFHHGKIKNDYLKYSYYLFFSDCCFRRKKIFFAGRGIKNCMQFFIPLPA